MKTRLGIWQLPAFLVSCGGNALLIRGVPTYEDLAAALERVSEGCLVPHRPVFGMDALQKLVAAHPLVSIVEVNAAFELRR